MTLRGSILRFPWRISAFLVFQLLILRFPPQLSALNWDGVLLLSFKYSVLSDPLSVLSNWNYDDQTPCAWTGVMCMGIPGAFDMSSRVVSLVLPNAELLGSIPFDLGSLQHLRHLDLSHNSLNGTLPSSLFNASELRILALSNNEISGGLPETVGNLKSLQFLNLSDNALTGKIPDNLTSLTNLTVLSLSNNYFFGNLPTGFDTVEILDLSSNLVNGSLPRDFGGGHLRSLNLSNNGLSGEIPLEFASRIPANASLNLSFNNLTGGIPDSLQDQKAESFSGNPDLCGKPLRNPCGFPHTPSPSLPNTSAPTSLPAFAAIPKTKPNTTVTSATMPPGPSLTGRQSDGGLKPGVIAGIVVGDLAGIAILSMTFVCLYKAKKVKRSNEKPVMEAKKVGRAGNEEWSSDPGGFGWSCLKKTGGISNEEDTTESYTEDEEEEEEEEVEEKKDSNQDQEKKTGSLVTVDGESELELETLLKASAYILGATASSIVYKAVLEDGTSLAVRRIGERGLSRFRDFENQVRVIAKLRHPNLVRIRGFYWGADEKLVIYDYVPNGSLANASYSYKKMGSSSPRNLAWNVRLRIARGVARGLAYLHEKKYVHGNLKPSNILLGIDMEPRIGDFGLERLVSGETSSKTTGDSSRHFGSRRSTLSRDSLQDLPTGASPSLSSAGCASPYHAPESLRNLKPHPKWDVYSFGIVLLELLSGKVFSDAELAQWSSGFTAEDKPRVLRMADAALRADVEANEEALQACFKLGFSCCSVVPQKRPCMKEALQILEKLPPSPRLIV